MNSIYVYVCITLCIAVAIIIIYLYIKQQQTIVQEKPEVYILNAHINSPKVVILAGTHGNEGAPSFYLNWLMRQPDLLQKFGLSRYYIVPFVNLTAVKNNRRNLYLTPDVNRSWGSNNFINSVMLPFILEADLIVDLHEAWGFYTQGKGSLGQTIHSQSYSDKAKLDSIIMKLNSTYKSDLKMRWTLLGRAPPISGSLGDFCYSKAIPYILVELAGQNNVVPLEERFKQLSIIIKGLFTQQ
jgi:predicted deacylase